MDGFIEWGWLHFATFGRAQAGGWATTDGLYCVRSRYADLRSEIFRVSYLKHEAQHFDDYERFPGLASEDLEYRAKLVELIYAESRVRLAWFVDEAGGSMGAPHGRAAHRIVEGLRSALVAKEPAVLLDRPLGKLRSASRRLFDANTEELAARK